MVEDEQDPSEAAQIAGIAGPGQGPGSRLPCHLSSPWTNPRLIDAACRGPDCSWFPPASRLVKSRAADMPDLSGETTLLSCSSCFALVGPQ